MSTVSRTLRYCLAINEALHQAMEEDDTVILIGQGVKSPWYVGNTARGLLERFGPERVIDTPVSENAITGAAVGAALVGMRPIVVHPRMDFMLYAFDPIINEAANWHYMFGGSACVPVIFWGIINRGGEQAAQHSQALHAMFAHTPGLKVVMPSDPYDAKGLMIASIRENNPVIYIDDRLLHRLESEVPEESYSISLGQGVIRKRGKDVTLIAISSMIIEALEAIEVLEKEGISVELIDPRTIKPLDETLIFESVKKTGRLIVVDVGCESFGISAEISALVSENVFQYLKTPVIRIGLPNCPAPSSRVLEKAYYPTSLDVIDSVRRIMKL